MSEPRPVEAAAAHATTEGLRRDGDRKLPLGDKARRTRNRLLLAAYEQFSETGYRGTKVGDISERAGVSLGTFYQYFDSRDDVMSSLVAEYVRGSIDLPPWRFAHGDHGIRRLLHHYVANYAATAAFQGVWEEATHVDEVQANVRRDLSTFMTERIEDEFATALTKDAAFPKRMGRPEEYGRLVVAIVENPMLNGSCIRLDAGQRFAPK